MKKQYIKALIDKATDSGFSFIASTAAVDRQGDSIDQSGWDVSDFLKNPVMLWAHDYTAPPVAKALSIDPTDPRGLVGTCEFAPTEFAQQIKTLVEGGFVSALSVGFIPKERSGNIITKSELLEISFVPVPANQEALILAAKSLSDKGYATDLIEKFLTTVKAEGEEMDVEPAEEGEGEAGEEEEVEKGVVSDQLDAEEAAEMKWGNLDGFFEIIGAFCDVYLDEGTPVESFPSLLLEVASLITSLAQDNGSSDDNSVQMAAFSSLLRKVAPDMDGKKALTSLIEKVGARHSSNTKKSLQEAKEHADAISTVLGAMLETVDASTEDGTDAGGDESADEKQIDVIEGKDAARALLAVRGVLRERTGGDQQVLSIINRHLAGRA